MTDLPAHELRRLQDAATGPDHLARLIEERRAGAPLQYLEGTAAFGPLELVVDARVLIPRPETEQLWELAVSSVESPAVVVDLGTGSGALGLALATTFPSARVVATDISSAALEVAAVNRDRLGLPVELYRGDLYEALPVELTGRIDLLVTNPPYVSEGEWVQLSADVRAEPRMALVAGPQGTEVWDRIIDGCGRWLAPSGVIVGEIGETQGEHVRARLEKELGEARIEADLTGRPRFVVARISSRNSPAP